MYLSKLEIFGFKSFAHKVSFQFNDGITAIIGPNGCGKSNIVDAIRWVLGEQRPTLLRLDRMENAIFNGTAVRKPLSMVEVSMLIENTRNILPSVYSEVKVTRRLYRSGESEYLLNKKQVRLKDIIDLFADTGMGSDAYSVIELKMVEQILSENAEERRRLFEEASGIKKYKLRRKSALRKLETTDQELVRLGDVISEVQKTVNSLSRQVGKARRYHQYKNDLKQKDLYIFQLKSKHFREDLVPLKEEFSQVRETRERLGKEVNQAETGIEKLQVKLVDMENKFREVSGRLDSADAKVREIQQNVQLGEQKAESLNQNIQDREQQIISLTERVASLELQEEQLNQEIISVSAEVENRERSYQQERIALEKAEQKLTEARRAFQEFREKNVRYMQEMTGDRDEFHKVIIEKENLDQQLQKFNQQRKTVLAEIQSREEKKSEADKRVISVRKDVDLNDREVKHLRQKIDDLEEEIQNLENRHAVLLGEVEKVSSRRDFLQNLIENYEGFSESVQYVMSRKNSYAGLIDILANMVDTEDQYRPALESYLEEIAHYLVVEGVDTARNILSEIRSHNKGRLTVVPLSILQTGINGKPAPAAFEDGAILLRDVVRFDQRFRKLFDFLFQNVVLVRDMDSAIRYHEKHPEYNFLTHEGDFVGEWGHITGGNSHHHMNLTGRKKQYEMVINKAEKLKEEQDAIRKNLSDKQAVLESEKKRLQEFNRQHEDLSVQVKETEQVLSRETYELEHWGQRLTETEDSIAEITERKAELEKRERELTPRIQHADEQQQEYRGEEDRFNRETEAADMNYRQLSQKVQNEHIELVEKQSQLKELRQKSEFNRDTVRETGEQITVYRNDIERYRETVQEISADIGRSKTELESLYRQRDVVEKEKLEIENNYQALKSLIMSREEEVKKLHRQWNNALERLKELELKIQEVEIKQKSQKEQFQDQYGAELDRMLEENPVPDNAHLNELQEEIGNIRQRIESLGEVNPLAVKEHEREKERLDFLKAQQSDLLEARKELVETISKLNKTARKLFMDTFEKISENFRGVFGKFFEGGKAELILKDNDDPLEANIDISVQIKGKRLTTLNLLSAGEKTLTAISLLFAIYLYKPSPFCILDEVDAPLDDVNIARYTHALKEFSANTQFILVTHNKMTMQSAQSMYGITMEEPGVSKVVSVRFD